MESGRDAVELATHGSIRDIGEETWSRFTGRDAPPFLSYTWLEALERHERVVPERGWAPLYLTLRRGIELIAVAPAFVKGNSDGEFVFDHSWAHFAEERLEIPYYPKLIVAVPFTPATGSRVLVAPGVEPESVRRIFVAGLGALCDQLELSGAHILFPPQDEAESLAQAGMIHRLGVQFHWRNEGYASFDDFLARFNSKHRAQIRRERRGLAEGGVRIEILTGADLTPEIADLSYDFYRSTVDKYFWGRRYLNRGFFREVCERMPEQLHVVIARDIVSNEPIAGAFNLLGSTALYGRYWGTREERPFLHFNVCYYAGVEDCIARGLELFEPGAGGEHKHARGFEATATHSVHLLRNPTLDQAVRDHADRERRAIEHHLATSPGRLRRPDRAAE